MNKQTLPARKPTRGVVLCVKMAGDGSG